METKNRPLSLITTISDNPVHGVSIFLTGGVTLIPVDFHMQLTYSNLDKGMDAIATQMIGGAYLRHVWFGLKKLQESIN